MRELTLNPLNPLELTLNPLLNPLTGYAKKKTLPLPKTLGAAVKLVASIGGHLGRSHDPEPGHQIMWRGYFYL
ncbi:MAG: hypothetical protein PVG22_16460, partial [Chromatiales bacterium]